MGWLDVPAGTSRGTTIVAVLAAAAAGTMLFLASADFDIWPLAYVAMVPALWVIDRAPTRRRALLYGFVTGLVVNVGGFPWIIELLTRHAALPWILAALCLVLLCAYQALVFVLFAWAVRSLRRAGERRLGQPLPMVLLAPLAMVSFEILVPFIFPWYLAVSQAWVAPMIQIADLAGPVGVTFVLMVVNGAMYDVLTGAGRQRLLPAAAGVAVVAGALGYGLVRMAQIDARRDAAPALKVGLVQSNVALEPAHARPADELVRDLQRTSAELERQGAQLLVWPESAYPYAIRRDAGRDLPEGVIGRVRQGFTVPLVLGAITLEGRAAGERDTYPHNSALLLDRDDVFRGIYDKIYLLIFGEYIPGLETFPFIRSLLPDAAGHFARGDRITTFPFDLDGESYRLGPMICYEDILPAFGRKLGAHHPHILVNLTNDTWFGDSAEPWQHLALSVFRAVELRTDLVRAVNTGVSAHVDAAGRVRAKSYVVDPVITPMNATGMVVDAALLEGGHTVYARIGDAFGYLCVAALASLWMAWIVAPWRARRRQGKA